MNVIDYICQDSKANIANPTKGKYVVKAFRVAQLVKKSKEKNKLLFYSLCWYLVLYRIVVDWLMGVELSWNLEAGKGLQLWHIAGLVIHGKTKIGTNCQIRQFTTFGARENEDGVITDEAPNVGNNVSIGCNCVILGAITIGNFAKIGAGSVVIKDVPPYAIVAGNPAKFIRYTYQTRNDQLLKVS